MVVRRLPRTWILLAVIAALLPLGVRADAIEQDEPVPAVFLVNQQQLDPTGDTIQGAIFECINSPEQKDIFVPSAADLGLNRSRTPGADVTVVYSGSWPVDAQAAFERAVATWENMVVTSAPIRLSATWAPLSGNILGQGGPKLWGNFPGAPLSNTWYPAALANSLCNCDMGGAGDFEMSITMNSSFPNWNFSTNPATAGQVDFETTALHEVTHGFGFAGSATVSGGNGYYGFSGLPTAYDRFVEDNAGTAVTSYTSGTTALAAVLQSNNVYFDGPATRAANAGNRAALYAPATWAPGSSYSHLANNFDNTPDALITYQLSYGESIRSLGPVTKGVFQDIGWSFAAEVPQPGTLQFTSATFNAAEASGTLNIPVTRTGGASGAASATCAVTGGTATSGSDYNLTTSSVSWIDGEATTKNCVVSLINDTEYESNETILIGLQSVTGATAGSPVSTTVTVTSEDPAPAGTLQFTSSTFAVTEGTPTVNISVSRTGGSNGAASAVCSVNAGSPGTATQGAIFDYTLSTSSVSWTNGDTATKNCVVTVNNDTAYEVPETVNLLLGSITGATAGSPTATTLTITSDDLGSAGSLIFNPGTYTQSETVAALSVTVSRITGSVGAASATCAITGGTATLGSDYTVGTSSVSWTDGELGDKTCTFTLINDTVYESTETVTLQLQSVTGATAGIPSTATINITSDDAANRGVVQFSSATYSVTEGTPQLNVVVTRTGGSDLTASATCGVTVGGTASGSDYSWSASTVSWTAGDSASKNCVLNIVDDALFEADETINIALQGITGATAGSPIATVVTIISNDVASPGVLQFSSATYSSSEATATFNIPVTRTGGTDGAVGVTCSVTGGTATLTTDYSLTTSTLSWANGESTTKNCVITVVNETLSEPDETVLLQLVSPTGGATIGAIGSTTATITNDDNAGVVQFTAATFGPINENGTTLSFTLSRSGGTSGSVTAQCSVDASSVATAPADFLLSTSSVTWGNGDATQKSCVVTMVDDLLTEGSEAIVLSVAITAGQATIGTNATASATINDNDNAGIVQFGSATYSVAENGTFIDLPVTRSGGTTGAVSVTCAVTGGTAIGSDYTLSNTTLNWNAGETGTKNCRVTPVNDSEVEPDETVIVSLQSATNGLTIGATGSTTVTITNDDSPGTLQFGSATYSVAENGTFIDIAVTRVNGTSGAASAVCSVSGGTASGGDYTLSNATVSWASGDGATKNCRVTPVNDSSVEPDETVVVSLGSITGAGSGALLSTTVTITNDDNAGTLQFSAASYAAVSEAAGTATYTVSRTGGSSGAVSATCTVDGTSTAASGADFEITSGLVSFADGDTVSKTCTVSITNDTSVEPAETMVLRLGSPTGGASIGAPATSSITITDNDNGGTIQFSSSSFGVVSEATPGITFTVTRTGGTSGAASATCSVAPASVAALTTDFTFTNDTVAWADGESGAKTCVIALIDDTSIEGTETVALQLGSVTGQATLGAPSIASALILDNDTAGVFVFDSTTYSVGEGAFIDVVVNRTGGTGNAVSVTCTVAGGGTASASDYTLSQASLSWASGEGGSKSCRITATSDAINEASETLLVQLANAAGGATVGVPFLTTVTITNTSSGTPGTIGFASATASGSESGGAISVTVTRTGGTLGAASAACAVTGGTASPSHYALGGSVSWADGDASSKTCTVTPVDDGTPNANRTVVLSLQSVSGATLDAGHATATVTIIDDDGAAAGLEFGSEPTGGVSGSELDGQPTIDIVNGIGQPVPGANEVTIEIDPSSIAGHPGDVTLTCTGGTTKTATNGVVSFSGCTVTAIGGIIGLRLRATAAGLESAVSAAFDIADMQHDADCDGFVTSSDALALMRSMAGYGSGVTVQAPCTGDFNGDQEVGLADILAIRRFVAGLP